MNRIKAAINIPLLTAGVLTAMQAAAQVYNGGGIDEGLDEADNVTGLNTANPRLAIINILKAVLNFLALIAVVMIIVAGFYLVLSMGNEEQKDKAKRIIIYTLIGLVVILFARIIVSLVTVWLASQV